MSEAKTSLGDAIRQWAVEARAELPADSPSDSDLEAYLEGRLRDDQKAGLRRHLVLDPEVTTRFLERVEAGGENDRQAIVEAMLANEDVAMADFANFPSRPPSRRSPFLFGWLTAALLLAGLGFGLWGLRLALRSDLETSRPILGPGPRTLELSTARATPSSTSHENWVEADGSPVVVSLTLVDAETLDSYRVELIGPEGEVLGGRAVRREPEGHILFSLETRGRVVGSYGVNLFGESNGSETLIANYEFELLTTGEGSTKE